MKLQNDKIEVLTLVILGSVVGIIYFIDAMQDVFYFPTESHSNRHIFTDKYFYLISIMLIAWIVISIVLLLFLRLEIILYGLVLSAFCALYLYLCQKNQKFRKQKEVFMAILFCLGTAGVALFIKTSINLSSYIIFFFFFAIILQHNLVVSMAESELDPESTNIYKLISRKVGLSLIKYLGLSIVFFNLILFRSLEYSRLINMPDILSGIGLLVYSLALFTKKFSKYTRLLFELLLLIFGLIFLFF
jgi:hypothetical protein